MTDAADPAAWEEVGGLLRRRAMPDTPYPEGQTLRGCYEAQRQCQGVMRDGLAGLTQSIEAKLEKHLASMDARTESNRAEQRAVNTELFSRLDAFGREVSGLSGRIAARPASGDTQPVEPVAARSWIVEALKQAGTNLVGTILMLVLIGLIGGLAYAFSKGWTP